MARIVKEEEYAARRNDILDAAQRLVYTKGYEQMTIQDILERREADTEIIAICDGYWPDPPVPDHPRVVIVHHTEPIGQRAATNEGARISQAEYLMKCDAHCAFGQGFDRILMADCQPDWTMIPMMWNLHPFDWQCRGCARKDLSSPGCSGSPTTPTSTTTTASSARGTRSGSTRRTFAATKTRTRISSKRKGRGG